MQLTVQGKQMDLGEALRTHVSDKLEEMNAKYFNRAIEAIVTFVPEGQSATKTHISIRIGKDIMVVSDAVEFDPYLSFDQAADKVAKQMRRYKRRLRDHHQKLDAAPEGHFTPALDYTISTEQDNDPSAEDAEHGEPLTIAEISTVIQTMSPSEAVMRLELSGQNALMFRNAQHNELNMVYRRTDGNVGWVDPDGNNASQQ